LTNELRNGGKLKVVGAEEDGQPESVPVALTPEPSPPPASYTRKMAPRTAEERQGLKQLASELRELLSLLEQETKGHAK